MSMRRVAPGLPVHDSLGPPLARAGAGLSPADIALPVRGIFQDDQNVDFRWATVEKIDFDQRLVHVDVGPPLAYDYLVIAAGSTTRWFGVPGVEEHALPMKTVADAT